MCVSRSVVSDFAVTPWTIYSPLESSVHGILQARILECILISFSRGSSVSSNQTWVSCIADRLFTVCVTRAAHTPQWFSLLHLPCPYIYLAIWSWHFPSQSHSSLLPNPIVATLRLFIPRLLWQKPSQLSPSTFPLSLSRKTGNTTTPGKQVRKKKGETEGSNIGKFSITWK